MKYRAEVIITIQKIPFNMASPRSSRKAYTHIATKTQGYSKTAKINQHKIKSIGYSNNRLDPSIWFAYSRNNSPSTRLLRQANLVKSSSVERFNISEV